MLIPNSVSDIKFLKHNQNQWTLKCTTPTDGRLCSMWSLTNHFLPSHQSRQSQPGSAVKLPAPEKKPKLNREECLFHIIHLGQGKTFQIYSIHNTSVYSLGRISENELFQTPANRSFTCTVFKWKSPKEGSDTSRTYGRVFLNNLHRKRSAL